MDSGKSVFYFTGTDEVGTFWIIIHPTKESFIDDILFEVDIFDLVLQINKGLNVHKIFGIYKKHEKAKDEAEKLLINFQMSNDMIQ